MQHLAKSNVPLYLRNKRAAKSERRQHRNWRQWQKSQTTKAAENAEFGAQSKILTMIGAGSQPNKSAESLKGHVKFVAPEVFSMTEDPAGTVLALSELAMKLLMPRVRKVNVDLHKVKKCDLAANALLDVLVEEVSVKARQTQRKIHWKGSYPADLEQRRMVRSLGVIRFLEVAHEYTSPNEAAHIEAFHERAKHYVRALRANETDRKSRVTQKFADHVNKCLRRSSKELEPSARKKLCDYVGEILDNAEEHAKMFDWTIQGYLDSSAEAPICEIAILNFGQSIAESLVTLPVESYTSKMIQPYLDAHSKNGFFGNGWEVCDLLTLIALQGSVSSKNFTNQDTRGNGTVDLISFFQKMSQECRSKLNAGLSARMTLVSGSTAIIFDGTYQMSGTGNGPGIIAFNSENDLKVKPDPVFVKHLSERSFPGTVLSIKFTLSPSDSTTDIIGD